MRVTILAGRDTDAIEHVAIDVAVELVIRVVADEQVEMVLAHENVAKAVAIWERTLMISDLAVFADRTACGFE